MMRLVQDPLVRAAMPMQARRPLPLMPAATPRPAGCVRCSWIHATMSQTSRPTAGNWTRPPPVGTPQFSAARRLTTRCPTCGLTARGEIGRSVRLGLVGDRTGRTEWVWPPEHATRGDWWTATLRAPSEPVSRRGGGAGGRGRRSGGVAFLCPREMGWLSVWVEPVLDSAYGLLLAGVALWLAAAFATGLPGDDGGRNFNAKARRTRRLATELKKCR